MNLQCISLKFIKYKMTWLDLGWKSCPWRMNKSNFDWGSTKNSCMHFLPIRGRRNGTIQIKSSRVGFFFEKWFIVCNKMGDIVVGLSAPKMTCFKALFWSRRQTYLAIKIKISNLFWPLLYKFCDTKNCRRNWQGKLNKWDKVEFAETILQKAVVTQFLLGF